MYQTVCAQKAFVALEFVKNFEQFLSRDRIFLSFLMDGITIISRNSFDNG